MYAGALTGSIALNTAEERALALVTLRLQEVLEQVAADGFPHYLCVWLYELATAFMRFYESCPILNADPAERTSRLLLCRATADRLERALELLGIGTVERM